MNRRAHVKVSRYSLVSENGASPKKAFELQQGIDEGEAKTQARLGSFAGRQRTARAGLEDAVDLQEGMALANSNYIIL